MLRVEQVFPCTLAEVLNSLLSYSILEMVVDTAEGETLICACAHSFEIVVSKSTIVAIVMQKPAHHVAWQSAGKLAWC
jgi:hypothetical protein